MDIEITKVQGPTRTALIKRDGVIVGRIRKQRTGYLLTDMTGNGSWESSFPGIKGLTNHKYFDTLSLAKKFAKKYFSE